ncbi:GTPase activating protein [Scheffersomyces coipomensis]|uniref:GTPase activating protein n=1 Tax=Scheffersomyces coipomensis TaxID=1788519 RepID=UPI00315D24DC
MSSIGNLIFPYTEDEQSTVSLNKVTFTDASDATRYTISLDEDSKQVSSIDKVITQTQQNIPELTQYIQNPSSSNDSKDYPLLIRIDPLYNKLKYNVSIRPSGKDSKSLVIVKTKDDSLDQIKHILYENKEDIECQVSKIDYDNLPFDDDSDLQTSQRLIINDTFDREFINGDKLNISLWELDSSNNDYSFLLKFSVWIDEYTEVEDNQHTIIHENRSPVSGDDKSVTAINSATTTTTTTTSPIDHHGTSKQFKISDFKKEFIFNIEDGPDFRTTLTKYEHNFSLIKKNFHQFNEEIKLLEITLKKLHHSKVKLIELLKNLIDLQFNSLLKQFEFGKDFELKLRSIFDPFEKNLKFFLKDVCEPKLILKIFHNLSLNNLGEQNSASSSSNSVSTNSTSSSGGSGPHNELLHRRKQFESNSKEYYSWLNKYLSNEKDRPVSKLLIKRKSFELSKFDYLNQLNQVTNNQYLNQLMEQLFKFINVSYDLHHPRLLNFSQFEDIKKSQDLIGINYKIYLHALSRFNSEKTQIRQMIEACKSNDELTNVIRYNKLNYNFSTPLASSNSVSSEASNVSETPSSPSIVGGSSISSDDILVSLDNIELIFSGNFTSTMIGNTSVSESPSITNDEDKGEMNGILYTLGGQGKQGWHKEWVVLNKGLLIEFSDWRKGRSPINQPIEIALSSIKPVTYERRQNCFEILTSKGNKHVFQALNEAERSKWIKALYNAGQVVDTTRLKESYSELGNVSNNGRTKKIISKLKTEFHIPQSSSSPTTVVVPGETHDRSISPVSITSIARHKNEEEKDYLNLVKSIPDSDNHICLDCGSTDSVEWISINNLACFCVKCASCHRNIGSHITKIRSLKLDKFENESEMLLNYINNRKVNEYLEESLPQKEKIDPNTNYEQRLEFIKKKYVEKKYKAIIPDINNVLIKAIQKINIPEVLRCIICGGDVDLKIQISIPNKDEYQIISIFEYSLRKFVEITEADLILSSSKKYFLISEILILNGSKIDEIKDLRQDIGLTDDAAEYWKIRSLKLSGGFV